MILPNARNSSYRIRMWTVGQLHALSVAAGLALACGPGKTHTVDNPNPSGSSGGTAGETGLGGAPSGGAAASGGATNALGGATNPAGGASGNPAAGGAASGGRSSGGAPNGGRSSGGAPNGGRNSGGAASGGRAGGMGGSSAGASSAGAAGQTATSVCDNPGLVWRSANKTNYTSYPDPGSEECIKFNGCTWAGQFAACNGVKPEAWVMSHNIVAAFPDFATLKLHELCLRKGTKTIVVTVFDTCGDSDCSGCCTQNKGSADQLIDIESYTDARWGVPDGKIEWADLGAATGDPCR